MLQSLTLLTHQDIVVEGAVKLIAFYHLSYPEREWFACGRSDRRRESLMRRLVSEVVAFAGLLDCQPEVLRWLQPTQSLSEVFRVGGSSETLTEQYHATVRHVTTRRREVLATAGLTTAASDHIPHGKVLATDLTSTMFDGVAGELTGGYFDHADAPSPETWLGVVRESEESPGYNGRVFLLSWVRQADVERVNVGIESTPSGCLSWVEDWRDGVNLLDTQ